MIPASTAVWPIPFLTNMFTALKESVFYFYFIFSRKTGFTSQSRPIYGWKPPQNLKTDDCGRTPIGKVLRPFHCVQFKCSKF